MVDKSEDTEVKEEKKSNGKVSKPKQPTTLIFFKTDKKSSWIVYPRLFNDEETAQKKLDLSYPHEDSLIMEVDLP